MALKDMVSDTAKAVDVAAKDLEGRQGHPGSEGQIGALIANACPSGDALLSAFKDEVAAKIKAPVAVA